MPLETLARIKRLIVQERIIFTRKAETEIERDCLTEDLVKESILNAPGIAKKLRSRNPVTGDREYLYVIVGLTFDDQPIYTKGKISPSNEGDRFYVLVSSKKAQ